MKIGMIFECGREGPDVKVCKHLARMVNPAIEIDPIGLDQKPKLIAECGKWADQLLKDGCQKVIIVWDLYPPWGAKTRPCLKIDRERIHQSLAEAGVTSPNVFLVCIEEELEAWLLADSRALKKVLPKIKPDKIKDHKKPEGVRNPKAVLTKLYTEAGRGRYTDYQHAEGIVKALPDLERLRKRCATFARFVEKLGGIVE